jgi:hypothetical protein
MFAAKLNGKCYFKETISYLSKIVKKFMQIRKA